LSPGEGVVARRLFPLQLIVCAAPRYLERHGAPQHPAELVQHRCSSFRHAGTGRALPWPFKIGDDLVELEVHAAFSTNDEELEMEAILAGQVLGVMTGVTAAAHVRAGRLLPVLTAYRVEHYGLYLYYGSRSAQPARVRAFIDLALERLGDSTRFVLSADELAAATASAPHRPAPRPPDRPRA
jgi:DNA-binding transcriptional LysR family regulator